MRNERREETFAFTRMATRYRKTTPLGSSAGLEDS
jgi:hypothetical protein